MDWGCFLFFFPWSQLSLEYVSWKLGWISLQHPRVHCLTRMRLLSSDSDWWVCSRTCCTKGKIKNYFKGEAFLLRATETTEKSFKLFPNLEFLFPPRAQQTTEKSFKLFSNLEFLFSLRAIKKKWQEGLNLFESLKFPFRTCPSQSTNSIFRQTLNLLSLTVLRQKFLKVDLAKFSSSFVSLFLFPVILPIENL